MDVQTATVVIAGISVVIAAINSILTSRRAERTANIALASQQAASFMQLYNNYIAKDMRASIRDIFTQEWETYDEWVRKYGQEGWLAISQIGGFFEGVAILVERQVIDIQVVADLMGDNFTYFWEKTLPIRHEWRKTFSPRLGEHMERLYTQLKQREQSPQSLTI